MDIPVSRLNSRMALHTPAEFPLGLVFVVGKVEELERPSTGTGEVRFSLIERGYRLRCELTAQAARQVQFEEGQQVRASGHLAFDPMRVDYFLVARDLEVVPALRQAPPVTDVRPILAEMEQRAKEVNLAPGQLPGWVKELAPPEFQDSLLPGQLETTGSPDGETAPADEETVTTSAGQSSTPAAVSAYDPNPQLTEFLLKALEADEDIELTPELIAEYQPPARAEKAAPAEKAAIAKKAAFKVAYPHDVVSPPPERIHWLIAAAIVVMVVLILTLVAYLAMNAL
jgi:hypothetical protein